ncbi:23194_t:CDS:2, partial [Dentiscutata erythropus]
NALFTILKNESRHSVTTSDKNINIVITNQLSKGMEKETIGDMVQQILRDRLSIRDIIEVTKFPDITENANKIQSVNQKKAEAKRIDYPDEFILESVKERLDVYNIKTLSDCQALADVMVMLCIRSAELKTLCIADAGVTGYAKNRGQPDIHRKFRSMEKNQEQAKELLTWIQYKPGVKWFNKFLKDYDLIPKYLRKLGAVYGAVAYEAKNMAHAYTIAGEYLRHSSDNHTSPVQNYVVVNYRKRGDSEPDPDSNSDNDLDAVSLKIVFFLLASEKGKISVKALIDTTSKYNTISKHLFNKLESDYRLEDIVGDDLIGEEIKGLDL